MSDGQLYIVQSVLCSCVWCSVQCAVCRVPCEVCSVQCAVYSVKFAVYSVQCKVCSVKYAVYSVQFAVCSVVDRVPCGKVLNPPPEEPWS